MKKTVLSLLSVVMILGASAQLSVGVAGNYTMYKGDFQRSTSGAQIRAGYLLSDKITGVLSFTYGMPIKQASMVTLEGNGGTQQVNSEIKYKFKTINLLAHYNFVGSDEETGKMYGVVGAGLVLVGYNEEITDSYDKNSYTPMDQIKGSDNGFTLNLGLGGQYKLGAPAIFAEAGLALPANQVNNQYVENVIPLHFMFNLGIKLDLGQSRNK